MKTIWKYPIQIEDRQTILVPQGAELLTVQMQNNAPFVWALVNPDNTEMPRVLDLYGTGHPIKDYGPGKYVGTFQSNGGMFVWHLFEPQR